MIQVQGNKIESTAKAREERFTKYLNAAMVYQKKNDILRTATCLYIINTEKLYLESGYNSITELCVRLMNISKGTVSNYMNICRKFIDVETAKTVFARDNIDFNYTQLVQLKRLNKEQVQEMLDNGDIKITDSAEDIKEAVSQYIESTKQKQAKVKEDLAAPIKEAYEAFNSSYNELKERVGSDSRNKELLQQIMDAVVVIYNDNDRLWN